MHLTNDDIDQTLRQAITYGVTERLQLFCTEQAQTAAKIHPLYGRLWQATSQQVFAGGKRLRPYLVGLVAQAYGYEIGPEVIDVAASWELLHIGLLMHDDIIDRDYLRHGQPNVAGQYLEFYESISDEPRRLHYAHSAALLAGDLLLSAAHQLIDSCELNESNKRAVRNILYQSSAEVIGGELLDTEVSIVDSTIDLQLVAQLKTASYSFIGPMLSGATIAGAEMAQLAVLRELGECLGAGFQLADDLLGVFGSQEVTGKSVDSDLAEGKRTVVVVEALQLMTPAARASARELLSHPSLDAVEPLRALIAQTPVEGLMTERLAAYAAQAHQLISQLKISKEHHLLFDSLATTLLERNN